jgi:hypothetical protein
VRVLKKITWIIVVFLGLIQFSRPEKNESSEEQPASIAKELPVPAPVLHLLKTACYDCHSNNTQYPWYMNIQPVAWFMARHIRDGKAELNFDEFGSYAKRRQGSKLHSIANSISDGSMPLDSYTWMHKEARLTDSSKKIIVDWALQQKNNLENRP